MKAFSIPATVQCIILVDAFKNFMNTTKKVYSLTHKSMMDCFEDFIVYVYSHNTMNKFVTYAAAKEGIKKYFEISNASDMLNMFINNKNELIKNHVNIKCIKYVKRNTVKSNTPVFISHRKDTGFDDTRVIAVRSKYGNTPVMFYEFTGSITINNKQINNIKMQYHYDTGCNYYEARPILKTTWNNLSDARKVSTTDVEIVEKEII